MAVPTNTETLNAMYVTTWQLRWKQIADQVMLATPLLYLLNKKGRRKSQSGGRYIEVPVQYAQNETIRWIGKGDNVTIQSTDPLTVAQYDWKYLTGHIVRYFVDWQQNRGPAAIMSKVNQDIDNLGESLRQNLETDQFGDSTGDDGKAINGLENLIDTTPATGTVGGLNRANYSWWQNNSTNMTGKTLSVNLLKYMRTMFNDCGQLGSGTQRFPDHFVTTQTIYEAYEAEIVEVARVYTGDKGLADLGFGELTFKGRPITWSPSCPAYMLYFLNSSAITWVVDPGVEFSMGEWLPIYDQPGDVLSHNLTACNLLVSCMDKLGKLYNVGN